MRTPKEILDTYWKTAEELRKINSPYRELRPLTIPELLFIRANLHPTAKRESKEVTRKMVSYIVEKRICMAEDIYRDLGYADKPVMTRMKKFMEHGLVRRECKKYYIATPRMLELKANYLERICGE